MLNRPSTRASMDRLRTGSRPWCRGGKCRPRGRGGGTVRPGLCLLQVVRRLQAAWCRGALDSKNAVSVRPTVPQSRFWAAERSSGRAGESGTRRAAHPLPEGGWTEGCWNGLRPGAGRNGGIDFLTSTERESCTGGAGRVEDWGESRSCALASVGPRADIRARATRKNEGKALLTCRMVGKGRLRGSSGECINRRVCSG